MIEPSWMQDMWSLIKDGHPIRCLGNLVSKCYQNRYLLSFLVRMLIEFQSQSDKVIFIKLVEACYSSTAIP